MSHPQKPTHMRRRDQDAIFVLRHSVGWLSKFPKSTELTILAVLLVSAWRVFAASELDHPGSRRIVGSTCQPAGHGPGPSPPLGRRPPHGGPRLAWSYFRIAGRSTCGPRLSTSSQLGTRRAQAGTKTTQTGPKQHPEDDRQSEITATRARPTSAGCRAVAVRRLIATPAPGRPRPTGRPGRGPWASGLQVGSASKQACIATATPAEGI
jgi:hypothetical protein